MTEELLEAKWALCKMIVQFMYENTDENGIEYFDNYCESAGEAAFAVLGFKEDRISKTAFYELYDKLNNELFMLRTGKPYPVSHLKCYLEDWKKRKVKLIEKQRRENLCKGCMYTDCTGCNRDDKVRCICPCDSCEEENGKMSNYNPA